MSNEQHPEVAWLTEARKHIGLRETKGGKHHPEIVQFWKDIKRGGIKDDETPWCAAFVGAMLERVGVKSTRFESAKSYLDWGQLLALPVVGCIVIFTREADRLRAVCCSPLGLWSLSAHATGLEDHDRQV